MVEIFVDLFMKGFDFLRSKLAKSTIKMLKIDLNRSRLKSSKIVQNHPKSFRVRRAVYVVVAAVVLHGDGSVKLEMVMCLVWRNMSSV